MRQIVYGDAQDLIAWAVERIGGYEFRPDAKAIGVQSDEHLVGVVVFDNHSPGSCCISVASDGSSRWLNRVFLIHVFAYPFIQLQYRRLTALISESNAPSIRFCESCGFQREGILREGAPGGEDMLVYGLLRRDCRFLPERFAGKVGRPAV
ncbi:MAG: hypothetical protein DI528_12870 [Shinella sp.]|nr:MAG: hypothetical protein DI528_12870 [Shinella sp.]